MTATQNKWAIAQPAAGMSFPELDRYTRSDTWNTITGYEFDSEEEALKEIDFFAADFASDEPAWWATWQDGDDYVSTIVGPTE